MARTLQSQALKRLSNIKAAAGVSDQFQKEITEETKLEDLSDDAKKRIVYLKDKDLLDDPMNAEAYGPLEEMALAESMKKYGFQGVILAYPIDKGRYRIESGHRRRAAAKKAGIKEYPVYVTEAPKSEWERKIRLYLGNLHGRSESPLTQARVAQGLYEAHRDEIAYRKKEGLIQEGEVTALNQLVAADMEVADAQVERLRALLNLVPELQKIADQGTGPWSDLSSASTLSLEDQKELAEEIMEKSEREGQEAINRKWLRGRISELKSGETPGQDKPKGPSKATAAGIKKATEKMETILSLNLAVRPKDAEATADMLRDLQALIDKKIIELDAVAAKRR